ncbi:MAG: hypothetical protein J6R00_07005 [Lentisphaeria bacterium]|nr:hypothetical protein [Lentisphaeria bacterium]
MNVKCFRAQYIKSLAAVLFSGVFLCGCFSHTAPEPQKPAFTPVMRVSDRMVARRKAAFKNIVKNIGVRGIAVYPGSWKHVPAQEVISKISAYGFNRIYFVITSECEIDGKLYELFAQAEKAKIGAHILLRQRDYFSPWQGNAFVRMFKTSYPQLVEVSKEIADLNEELVDDKTGRVAGFSILLEPHRFTTVAHRRGGVDGCFIWSEKTFGAGLDNDMLMKKSMADARAAAKSAVPFTPAIADFYHDWAVGGKLSTGTVDSIAALSTTGTPEVLLLSSGNKPTEVPKGLSAEFAQGKCRIIPVMLVADHLSVDKDRFRRRNYTDFLRGVKYGTEKMAENPNLAGFVTGPLRALEYMCYEEE